MSLGEATTVRCMGCRFEYEPRSAGAACCPRCGGVTWVSARIALPPGQPKAPRRIEAARQT